MKTHVVLGATGGIGRATVKALLERGESVRILVRDRKKADRYFAGLPPIEVQEGDVSDRKAVVTAVKGSSSLFYCVNLPYPRWEKEVRSLLAVAIDAAIETGARLIFPGNVYVYGHAQKALVNEQHPYGAHTRKGKIRIEMEQMLADASKTRGLAYTIVRMPDFYGPFVVNGFSEKIFQNALTGNTVRWAGSLDAPYETILVDDGAEAMVTAGLTSLPSGSQFNVPGGGETTARRFLTEIVSQAGTHAAIATLNSSMLVGLAGLFNPVIREFQEMMYLKQERLMLDGTLYASTFGSIPRTPYAAGIARTLEWAKGFTQDTRQT